MSESARPWSQVTIGDLVALDYGGALSDNARSGDGYPVYGSNGQVGRNATALVEGPGVVVGRKGTVGAVTWSAESFWPIDTTYYVRWLNERQVDRRWIYWYLSSLPLNRLDSSTGVPGLNRNDAYTLLSHCRRSLSSGGLRRFWTRQTRRSARRSDSMLSSNRPSRVSSATSSHGGPIQTAVYGLIAIRYLISTVTRPLAGYPWSGTLACWTRYP